MRSRRRFFARSEESADPPAAETETGRGTEGGARGATEGAPAAAAEGAADTPASEKEEAKENESRRALVDAA